MIHFKLIIAKLAIKPKLLAAPADEGHSEKYVAVEYWGASRPRSINLLYFFFLITRFAFNKDYVTQHATVWGKLMPG